MITAAEKYTPHLDGWHLGDTLIQGTGGHGDSAETYSETYAKVNSLVTVTEKLNTGKRNEKGKIIYYSHSYKVNRVSRLGDMLEISPLIYDAFLSAGFSEYASMDCYDLMKWQTDKNGNEVEVKKGLSFCIGDFEARLIGRKHAFLFKSKIVRNFKGKA